MRQMTWPQEGQCELCGATFVRHRPVNVYCKSDACQKARQRVRWERWRAKKEEAGTYRDDQNVYQRAFRERTGYARDYELRTKYGITLTQWLAMVDAVGGKCEICGKNDEAMCVDHCHDTGRVRGVLCRKCNRAMGQLGDTPDHLARALTYLTR